MTTKTTSKASFAAELAAAEAELFRLSAAADVQGELVKLTKQVIAKVKDQADYNLTTNVPRGIVAKEDAVEHSINHGVAGGIAAYCRWDALRAAEIAAALLAEVNMHEAAEAVRKIVNAEFEA